MLGCGVDSGCEQELGWDPEWEVNPKELKLIEKIGAYLLWLTQNMNSDRLVFINSDRLVFWQTPRTGLVLPCPTQHRTAHPQLWARLRRQRRVWRRVQGQVAWLICGGQAAETVRRDCTGRLPH